MGVEIFCWQQEDELEAETPAEAGEIRPPPAAVVDTGGARPALPGLEELLRAKTQQSGPVFSQYEVLSIDKPSKHRRQPADGRNPKRAGRIYEARHPGDSSTGSESSTSTSGSDDTSEIEKSSRRRISRKSKRSPSGHSRRRGSSPQKGKRSKQDRVRRKERHKEGKRRGKSDHREQADGNNGQASIDEHRIRAMLRST